MSARDDSTTKSVAPDRVETDRMVGSGSPRNTWWGFSVSIRTRR
jgi:hypothetical protein